MGALLESHPLALATTAVQRFNQFSASSSVFRISEVALKTGRPYCKKVCSTPSPRTSAVAVPLPLTAPRGERYHSPDLSTT